MRRRREWFERLEVHTALWWVPTGHLPTVGEAEERVAALRALGPTPFAFGFRAHFPAPLAGEVELVEDDRELCPSG